MTVGDYGGQRANMEDDSMVGTLACQAEVIWPHERVLLERHAGDTLKGRVLDLACGTGEVLRRLREAYAPELAVGIDLYPGHLAHAGSPVVCGDGYRMPFRDGTFDLVLVRHLLQALPDPVGLLSRARHVLRPGGRIHVLAEDYLGLFFDADADEQVEGHFAAATPKFYPAGTDLFQGRRAFRHLREAGFKDVTVAPLVVDNRNSDRVALAGVFRYWRDGYAATLAGILDTPEEEIRRRFDTMANLSLDPDRYTAWLLFVLSANA